MKLYHGSNIEIDEINLSLCKPFKDFGQGFYLTTLKKQAESMARRTQLIRGGDRVVTSFVLDEAVFNDKSIKQLKFDEPSEKWALFVMANRNNMTDAALNNLDLKYGLVRGPIANDDMAMLFHQFEKEFIDLPTLKNRLKFRNLNNQISFHNDESISYLSKNEVFYG